MRITTFPLGPLQTNCYLLDDGTRAVVVDPGGDPDSVLLFVKQNALNVSHILCTHLHFDHIQGVNPLRDATKAVVCASPEDAFLLESEMGLGGMWGVPRAKPFSFEPLHPGDLTLLDVPCRILATPGHTPGGLSIYVPSAAAVFSGDALFYRSIGRTDFPRGDLDTLSASITKELFSLPGDTRVYPGHGQTTTIADERLHNPFLSDIVP